MYAEQKQPIGYTNKGGRYPYTIVVWWTKRPPYELIDEVLAEYTYPHIQGVDDPNEDYSVLVVVERSDVQLNPGTAEMIYHHYLWEQGKP